MIIVQELHKCEKCGHTEEREFEYGIPNLIIYGEHSISPMEGWTSTHKGYQCDDCSGTNKSKENRFSMVIQCSICKEEHACAEVDFMRRVSPWLSVCENYEALINFFYWHYKCNQGEKALPTINLK